MAYADDKAAVTTEINKHGADGTDDNPVAPYITKADLVRVALLQQTMIDNLEARVTALDGGY